MDNLSFSLDILTLKAGKGLKKPHVVDLDLDLQPLVPHLCSLQRVASRWMRVRDSPGSGLGASGRADGGSAMSGGQCPHRGLPLPARASRRLRDASAHASARPPRSSHRLLRRSLFISSPSSPSPPPLPASPPSSSSFAAATSSSCISLAWLCVARSDKDNVPALTLQPPCLLLGFGAGGWGGGGTAAAASASPPASPSALLQLLDNSSLLPHPALSSFLSFFLFFFLSPARCCCY